MKEQSSMVLIAGAAVGFTVKSGWASAVLVSGTAASPRVEQFSTAGSWHAEQKAATLAAWLVLAGRGIRIRKNVGPELST